MINRYFRRSSVIAITAMTAVLMFIPQSEETCVALDGACVQIKCIDGSLCPCNDNDCCRRRLRPLPPPPPKPTQLQQLTTNYHNQYYAVSNALKSRLGDRLGIYQYLYNNLPPLQTGNTLDELRAVVERFAQWVTGYRQAYNAEADNAQRDRDALSGILSETSSLNAERKLLIDARTKALHDKDMEEKVTQTKERLVRARSHIIDLYTSTHVAEVATLQELGSYQNDFPLGDLLLHEDQIYDHRRSVLSSRFRLPDQVLPEENPYIILNEINPPMPTFTSQLEPWHMVLSSKPTTQARIEQNLSYIDDGRQLVSAVERYINLQVDKIRPETAKARRALQIARSNRDDAFSMKAKTNNDLHGIEIEAAGLRVRLEPVRIEGLTAAARSALWHHLRDAAKFLIEHASESPEMMHRFLEVQEGVVKFAQEDIDYLPKVVDVIAHGSPHDIQLLETQVSQSMCEFAVDTEFKIKPLPERLSVLQRFIRPCP